MKKSKRLEKIRTKAYNGYAGTPYNVDTVMEAMDGVLVGG